MMYPLVRVVIVSVFISYVLIIRKKISFINYYFRKKYFNNFDCSLFLTISVFFFSKKIWNKKRKLINNKQEK